ncbi:MAG TPA: SIMPL domain-containing protein [Methanocorpusculum sp.]|nr:SIMPL domain-containing protein [Methanocorpusculum sp.]
MKTKTVLFTALVLAAVAFLCVLPAAADDSIKDHVITVSGYGESTSTPDMATLTLGIETEGTDAAKVQKENTEKMNKVISALKSAGIADSDIKTNRYSMYSNKISEYNAGKYPAGTTVYYVSNTVSVTTYDVSKVGDLIDKAVAAGANNVNSLQFSLSNEKYIQERKAALVSAVKAARADADAVAGALGISITGTGHISIDQSYKPVSYTSVDAVMMYSAEDAAVPAPKAAAGSTSVESGSLKTTATVSITYLY